MRRQIINRLPVFLVLILWITGCRNASIKNTEAVDDKKEIMVFAAASLTDVLSVLVDSFEQQYSASVKLNLASSGTLARQITQGETPDLYLSASKKWANYIDSLGYMIAPNVADVAMNQLVLIAPLSSKLDSLALDSTLDFASLLEGGRLSIGDPAHVPAGRYAKQALAYYGWYNSIDEKILPAKDVRSALMVVEMGEAPLGVVYQTDAQKSDKVKVIAAFASCSHKPIVYVAGVCKLNAASNKFFLYLNSPEANKVWARYGFQK